MKCNIKRLLCAVLTLILLAGPLTVGGSALQRLHPRQKVSIKMVLQHPDLVNPKIKVPVEGAKVAIYRIASFGYDREAPHDMLLYMREDLWKHDYKYHGGRLRWTNIKESDDYERKMPIEYLLQDIEEMEMSAEQISAPSDENGMISFEDFQCGLYLVVLLNPQSVDCTMRPFLATFPQIHNGEYDLDGSAGPFHPKTEISNSLVDIKVTKVWKGDREAYYESQNQDPTETSGATEAAATKETLKPAETIAPPRETLSVETTVQTAPATLETTLPGNPSATEETWPSNVKPNRLIPRPESIIIELWNGDQRTKTAKLSAANHWTYTFKDLPRAGHWRIVEHEVPKYKSEVLPVQKVDDEHYEIIIVNTADGVLVQTGELNWPVPVLLISGTVLIMAGFVLLQDKKKREI